METVGERIKHLRNDHGLTQKDFADMIGISRSTLAGYETGKIEPSLNVVYKMSNVFNINPSYFLRTMFVSDYEPMPNDIVEKLDELMKSLSTRDVRVNNYIVKHGSELSRLIYFEVKKLRESLTQYIKLFG